MSTLRPWIEPPLRRIPAPGWQPAPQRAPASVFTSPASALPPAPPSATHWADDLADMPAPVAWDAQDWLSPHDDALDRPAHPAATGRIDPGRQTIPQPAPQPAPRRTRRDPSPSRLRYRLSRLWLTPAIRRLIKLGFPAALLAATVAAVLSGADRRAAIVGAYQDLRTAIETRPEFMVHSMSVHTDSPELARALVDRLALSFPVSSFRLDLEDLRLRAEGLDAVESAAVRIRPGGVLELTATERDPVAIWRHPAGLELLDAEGRRLAVVSDRNVRPDLPLVAGEGAPQALAEARSLLVAAQPVAERTIGLVRVGERRWDLILTGGQRILLPPTGALPALERVLALHAAQDLLSRDVTAVDMRNPARPTIRVSRGAIEALTQVRRLEAGGRSR
jgi:cell division protein FtsQ